MKVAIIYNEDMTGVINTFGMQNKEVYNPSTVRKVVEALEKGGHNVEIIDGNINVIENLQNFMPKVLEGERLGMVFNMAYGIQGESRYTHIPSMLEMLGIPYVGSSPSGHVLALDKVITKIILQKHNIPTPDFWVFSSRDDNMNEVKYPIIVKPKMESVSFGLKVVYNETELKDAVKFIVDEFKQQALAEQFIKGREFSVGILGNDPLETFNVLEIDLGGDPNAVQTVENKQKSPRQKICPAKIPEDLAKEMQKLSIAAFKELQLRDFARVDIRLDENNRIFLLEVNSMASLGPTGSYVYAAAVNGYDYTTLVNKILDVAVVRYFANSILLAETNAASPKPPLPVRIRSYLRSRQENSEKLLRQIIDINTHVRNVEGVNQLGNIIKKQLTSLVFNYEVFPQVEVGNILFFSNTDNHDYDVLLLGNLDNSTKNSRHEYFRKSGQKIFGTGIWEHKGGLLVMLLALQALKFTRLIKKIKIGILLTTDDTLKGRFAKTTIKRKTDQAKYVIGLHGAFLNGGIVTSRSGAAVYECSMNLRKTDDAENVVTAINAFSRLVTSWTALSNVESGLVISPTEVVVNSNITEPYAHGRVTLSVRFNYNAQIKDIDNKICKLIPTKYKRLLQFQIEGGERRPAMQNTKEVEEFWNEIYKIAEQLDIRLRKEHRWSSADIAFVDQNKYLIDGLGPIGIKQYNSSEYILRYSLLERAALLAMILNKLSDKCST